MSELPIDERIQTWFSTGFDKSLTGMQAVSWGEGRARLRLKVVSDVENMGGTLHGGAIATLVDDAGTLAIMSADVDSRPGVTTDLNVSYLNPARSGTTVLAEARAVKSGRTLAFVEVEIKTEAGKLIALGRMTKFMGR